MGRAVRKILGDKGLKNRPGEKIRPILRKLSRFDKTKFRLNKPAGGKQEEANCADTTYGNNY
jgi:hypothetical protein